MKNYVDLVLESLEGKVEYRLGMAMTPENYVIQWARHRRRSDVPLAAWERAFQDTGQIEAAERLGYITIGRDVACTITLLPKGRDLLKRHYGD